MNLHPILVHFPIALLSAYAVLELIRFNKVKNQPYWFYIKAALVILGTLGAYAAYLTGDAAVAVVRSGSDGNTHLIGTNWRAVVSMHENFATISTIIFTALAAAYLVAWINRSVKVNLGSNPLQKIWSLGTAIQKFLIDTRFVLLAALAGLAGILITGALGGLIVYGPNQDPATKLAYKLLVPNAAVTAPATNTQTYKNETYRFEFQYPKDWSFSQPTYYNLQEPIVQVSTPQNAYPKTNFGDAAFTVSWDNAASESQCLAINAPGDKQSFKDSKTINGITYHVADNSGAGAGNFYESTIYRYYKQRFCFEATATIHTTNIDNYEPGAVTAVDEAPIKAQLDQIVNSLKFN